MYHKFKKWIKVWRSNKWKK